MYTLPALPYAYNALEPYLDEPTMRLHHDKHHQTYVDKLNLALTDYPELQTQPIEDLLKHFNTLPDAVKTAVKNHGGGHINHTLYWNSLMAKAPSSPSGPLADALIKQFGDFESFKTKFSDLAVNHFGSGWAWLVCTGGSRTAPTLNIYSLPNQDSPLLQGHTPLLGIDVWEHAYYLKYQNRRAEYVAAIWNILNWPYLEKLYTSSL